MNFIFQSNSELNKHINKYGCFMLDLVYLACLITGKEVTTSDINKLYSHFLKAGFIDINCRVTGVNEIIDSTIYYLTNTNKVDAYQVGIIRNGEVTFWGNKIVEVNYTIKKLKVFGAEYHFILCDRDGNTIYDSYDKPYKVSALEYVTLYKVQS